LGAGAAAISAAPHHHAESFDYHHPQFVIFPQGPRIKLRVDLVFGNSNASFEMYLKNVFQVFMKGNYYDQCSKRHFWRPEAQHAA
jgi:hypothetical protein